MSVLKSEFAKVLFPGVKNWFDKEYNERGLPMESGAEDIDGADVAKMEGAEIASMSYPSSAGFGVIAPSTFTTPISTPGSWTPVPVGTIITGTGIYPSPTPTWPVYNHSDVLFKAMYKEMQVAVLEGADQATLVKLYSGYFSQIEAAIRMETDSKELISKLKEIEAEADAKLAALKHSAALATLSSTSSGITPYSGAVRYSDMAGAGYADPRGTYGTTTS